MNAGEVWIEPDKHESMLHVEGQARNVEGVFAVVSWGRPSVCGGSVCRGGLG